MGCEKVKMAPIFFGENRHDAVGESWLNREKEKRVGGGIFSNADKRGAWMWYTFWNDLKTVGLLSVTSLLFSLKLWLVITLFCPINMTM